MPAGQSAAYEVVYVPMVMTAEGEKHEGTAFFALPDGSAIMHNLEGVAEPPMEAGVLAEQLPCKRTHLVPLAVRNWLKVPQRFRVEIRAPDKVRLRVRVRLGLGLGLTLPLTLTLSLT